MFSEKPLRRTRLNKKAIVFGGSGFLGSHVADCLTVNGYEVTIFDLNPSQFLLNEQKMITGDILDKQAVFDSVSDKDVVYNFAGIADLDDATTKPIDTVRLNIMGNINIMEASVKTNVERFVYASSIYVYSQKGGFYRCSKQSSEVYIEEYQGCYGLNYTVLRYGTLYGPRADERNSIYRYLKEALNTGCIKCEGTGEEMREYVNVQDAARLSVEILHDEYRNKHVIISGHHPMKFKDMLFMIREIIDKDIAIEFSGAENRDHYNITPYSFSPKIGQKLVSHLYLDMGQGILECLHEIGDRGR
jgi:UDP-glucose 4-epimerase